MRYYHVQVKKQEGIINVPLFQNLIKCLKKFPKNIKFLVTDDSIEINRIKD